METVEVGLHVAADADFADLFEVKDALKKTGELYREVRDGALVLGYRRQDFVRETAVSSSEPAAVGERGLSFRIQIPPHGVWTTCLDVIPHADRAPRSKHGHGSIHKPLPNMKLGLEKWIDQAPKLESSWDKLGNI